jgi:hypothetical protein
MSQLPLHSLSQREPIECHHGEHGNREQANVGVAGVGAVETPKAFCSFLFVDDDFVGAPSGRHHRPIWGAESYVSEPGKSMNVVGLAVSQEPPYPGRCKHYTRLSRKPRLRRRP